MERTAKLTNLVNMNPSKHQPRTAIASVLAALSLFGCDQGQPGAPVQVASDAAPAPLPLTTDAPPAFSPAPAPAALARAPAARYVYLNDPRQQYAYADRAYGVADVLGDTPPDYGFDYEGAQPWAWRGDGFVRVVEPTPSGERYYYYETGAASPYLIQDGPYSYAYSGGDLVVVYGPGGRALPPSQAQTRAALAGRYLYRARALYQAALAAQRRAVTVDAWRQRREGIDSERADWSQEQARYPEWRDYHDAHQAQNNSDLQNERGRRQAEAQGYRQALSAPQVAAGALMAAAAHAAAQSALRSEPPRPPQPPAPARDDHPAAPVSVAQPTPAPKPTLDHGPGPRQPGANGDHPHGSPPAQPPATPSAPSAPQAANRPLFGQPAGPDHRHEDRLPPPAAAPSAPANIPLVSPRPKLSTPDTQVHAHRPNGPPARPQIMPQARPAAPAPAPAPQLHEPPKAPPAPTPPPPKPPAAPPKTVVPPTPTQPPAIVTPTPKPEAPLAPKPEHKKDKGPPDHPPQG